MQNIKRRGKIKSTHLAMYIFAIFWSVMTLFPLLTTLMSSFKSNPEIFSNMLALPKEWLVQNYVDAVGGANILNAVKNSLILALGTSVVVIIITLLASYIFSRKTYKFVKPVYLLFLTGLMLPEYSAIIPISKISASVGATDSYPFLILIYAAFQLPQAIFLTTGYMNGISRELDEAATIDGCGMLGTLFRVITPVSTPIISTVAILVFIYGYKELVFSITLINDKLKFPVSRALMFFTGERITRMGPVFASIIIAVIPMVILYLIFHEKVQSGMVAGAVKG